MLGRLKYLSALLAPCLAVFVVVAFFAPLILRCMGMKRPFGASKICKAYPFKMPLLRFAPSGC